MKKSFIDLMEENSLFMGRMISGSKRGPEGHVCVWNANIITKTGGKVWFGDLNITKEGDKLKKIAEELGEPLYVLREMDARFGTEGEPVENLIQKAKWNTTQ